MTSLGRLLAGIMVAPRKLAPGAASCRAGTDGRLGRVHNCESRRSDTGVAACPLRVAIRATRGWGILPEGGEGLQVQQLITMVLLTFRAANSPVISFMSCITDCK
ncbi:hypothetical protein GN958_ATG10701 [Phytophthora infestans]|uniref:Uncharacterized protein n=1 Tax=Phytophthora infestans TaxID=4787 RepID=A0A8S9UKT6_PHYIN|nr:hypothetical protein GN958_ATG10701 [Phytophthora infestans]